MGAYSDYIDIVAVRLIEDKSGKLYLFCAPRFSHIRKGDEVIVETVRGESRAEAVASVTMSPDSDMWDIILQGYGETTPLNKVKKLVSYYTVKYDDEEKKEGEVDGTDNY